MEAHAALLVQVILAHAPHATREQIVKHVNFIKFYKNKNKFFIRILI